MGYLVEEIGEVLIEIGTNPVASDLIGCCGRTLAAAGKTLRWGTRSYNPELPEAERETNADWLRREVRELEVFLLASTKRSPGALSQLEIEIEDALGAISRIRPYLELGHAKTGATP
jgi:hypothetical protein